MKIIYPAIFHKEESSYWVEFPDLVGCQTYGDSIFETYEFAKEALEGHCTAMLEHDDNLPEPSELFSLDVPSDCFTTLVEVSVSVVDGARV